LALMRSRRTLEELRRLQQQADDPAAIGRLIDVVENELGYPLYEAIGRLKRGLSAQEHAIFTFVGGGLDITADVSRSDFEAWIGEDLTKIERCVDDVLAASGLDGAGIDRVFLTGGSSLIPAVRRIFERRFRPDAIASGGELTSIAHGLALIGERDDIAAWAA